MRKYLPFLLLALPFFLQKITNLGIWLSDSNIYFYTGYKLLHGHLLYRDIFFTNFPVFPYIAAFYNFITFGNAPLFYFTATIETLIVGFLIYFIVLRKTKDILTAWISSAIYLFSFIILATSDHQTGVFLASVFAVLSYFCYEEKKFKLTGFLLGLTILTKAYFLPIVIALILTSFLTNKKQCLMLILSFGATIFVILLPFLIFAPQDIYKDIVLYSLTRSQGVSKMNIAWFFIKHDIILFMLLFWNMLLIRKYLFFGLCSLFGLLFFIFYKDIYYLYLNFLIPFLCLSFPNFSQWINKTFSPQKFVIPSLILIILFINFFIYTNSYRTLQKLPSFIEITTLIQKQKPAFLYGTNDITPLLAYKTNVPLLADIVDTNENIFRKGFLNKTILTKEAIAKHGMLISHGAMYPEFNVVESMLGGIFDLELARKHCKMLQSFPVRTEGVENSINVFVCQ